MWLTFMIGGVVAAAVTWLSRPARIPWGLGWLLRLIVALTIAWTAFYFLRGPETLGNEPWWQISPWRESSLFVAMLAGMASRYVTKAIEDRREQFIAWKSAGRTGTRPGIEFDKWEFVYPLMISVITFGALLSQIKNDQATLENVVLSFQTGFFWQTLLASKTRAT